MNYAIEVLVMEIYRLRRNLEVIEKHSDLEGFYTKDYIKDKISELEEAIKILEKVDKRK